MPPEHQTHVGAPIAEIKHIDHELEKARARQDAAALRARPMRATGVTLPRRLKRDDLRKAIVLNEILGKPLALREPSDF